VKLRPVCELNEVRMGENARVDLDPARVTLMPVSNLKVLHPAPPPSAGCSEMLSACGASALRERKLSYIATFSN
jgi:hypothetical protein